MNENYNLNNKDNIRSILISSLIILWITMIVILLNRSSILLPNFSEMGRYSLYMLGLSLAVLIINNYRILTFPVFFTALVWIFHFGLFVSYYFNTTELITFDYLKEYYTVSECRNGYLICMVFYFFLTIGLLKNSKQETIYKKNINVEIKEGFVSLCSLSFIICLIPYYYYIIRNISSGSYDGFSLPGFMGYINYILYSTSIIVFYASNKKKKNLQCLLIAIAFFPSALTGARAEVICLYLVFFLLYFREKHLRLSSVLCFFTVSIIVLYIIHVIGLYRTDLQDMMNVLFNSDSFIKYLQSNPILSMAGEFGSTVISVIGVERSFDQSTFFYGKTYIAALSTIIPKLNSVIPIQYLIFTLGIPRQYYHNLGGSFFGEAYVNFGWLGCVLVFLLGRIIRKMHQVENRYYRYNETVYLYIQVIYCFLFLVIRGYIKNIFFMGFWCGLGVYLYNRNIQTNIGYCKYFLNKNIEKESSKYIRKT